AYSTMLAFNLEPVYGVIFAFFILNDAKELSTSFYIGGILILALVIIHPFVNRKMEDRKTARDMDIKRLL
ncbi:MAG: hypothetical protein HKN76_04225, partial [Saprospiraceae bacterium]|nr:hypothetical protein [Saprospiraceae bacterium]